jgi:phosphatidate phosphatase APP1
MSQSNAYGSYPPSNAASEERVPGRRRQKVFGYLKAANELRQSYQSQWTQRQDSDDDMPGSFPDVDIVRSGDEEMLLFPSYARKHIKKEPSTKGSMPTGQPGAHEDIERPEVGDAEYWKKEWEKYEDDNAIVDVDVRGWIYSPHRTPMSRRNRLVVAVARRLSGIPAPSNSPGISRTSSQAPPADRFQANSGTEDAAAAREAQKIVERGEAEASAARRGGYSEEAVHGRGRSNSGDSQDAPGPRHIRHAFTDSDIGSGDDDPAVNNALLKRRSWNVPSNMTQEELSVANAHLMNRLKPFLTVALTNTPITVFFFNDEKSLSKSVHTNDSGHFSIRASLDFVPTAIRVLASEKLSATEKVHITEMEGVSLISDIDDTIKHSAIASGAREIFRNTFIRDLNDLTIQGVKEWYTKMAGLGVQLHYVSNSPWQLYPLIRSYFSLAGLPPGSFHLKQYTGMLQGIFEPAAERKKGSLDKIMADFPERKFILVGDSGEADLEVYTDVVMENPGKILAVFIRDVTTPQKKKFFDQTPSNSIPDSKVSSRNSSTTSSNGTVTTDAPEERPALPSRPRQTSTQYEGPDLIDFSDELDPFTKDEKVSYSEELKQLKEDEQAANRTIPPRRPAKPSSLRSVSTESQQPTNHDRIPEPRPGSPSKRPPPPKPRRPSATVHMSSNTDTTPTPTPSQSQRAPFSSTRQNAAPPPPPPSRKTSNRPPSTRTDSTSTYRSLEGSEEGYAASAKRLAAGAYAALPSIRSDSPTRAERPGQSRRGLSSYPAAAARWATGATGGDPLAGGDGGAPVGASIDKKEEIWRRRWQHAEYELKQKGVVLRSWRVGGDVMDEAVRIVERAMRDLAVENIKRQDRRGGVSESGHYKLIDQERVDGGTGRAKSGEFGRG